MKNPFADSNQINISTSIIEPDSWGCMVEGYFWAAKSLLEQFLESNSYQNRWATFPILYNIRHFYELALKDILVNLGYIANESLLQKNHKLDDLIELVSKNVKIYYRENENRIGLNLLVENIEKTIKGIRNEMKLFIDYDNNSFAFRYPYLLNGDHAIKKVLKFDCRGMYDSLMICRKLLSKIITQLVCDDNNPMLKGKIFNE